MDSKQPQRLRVMPRAADKKAKDIRSVHVFDVDGPLYEGDSLADFIEFLWKRKLFAPAAYHFWHKARPAYQQKHLLQKEFAEVGWRTFARGIQDLDTETLFYEAARFVRQNKRFFHEESTSG